MSAPQIARKLPVEVLVKTFNGGERSAYDVVDWINANGASARYSPAMGDVVMIDTLEGTMTARVGDKIIQGVGGEFYPCKSDIFESTYEPLAGGRSRMDYARDAVDQAARVRANLSLIGGTVVAFAVGFAVSQIMAMPW